MFNRLEDTEAMILWEIPAGKPNSQEHFLGTGVPDTRSRVASAGQKNETCTYYAFNFFRPRIGKHPESDPELRRIERLFSSHRKQHTYLLNTKDTDIHTITSILLQLNGQPVNDDISREEKLTLLKRIQADPNFNGHYSEWITTNHLKAMIELNEQLLHDLRFDLGNFHQEFFHKVRMPSGSYSDLPLDLKMAVSSSAITFARLHNYSHLTISTWTHQDGPALLMAEIRRFGPINVRGYYGDHYYQDKALFSKKDKLHELTVYAWKPNTRLEAPQNVSIPTHSIAVVGLIKETTDKYFVLFVDPRDASILSESRKIYQLSYDNFTKYMGNLYGLQTNHTDRPGEDCLIRFAETRACAI